MGLGVSETNALVLICRKMVTAIVPIGTRTEVLYTRFPRVPFPPYGCFGPDSRRLCAGVMEHHRSMTAHGTMCKTLSQRDNNRAESQVIMIDRTSRTLSSQWVRVASGRVVRTLTNACEIVVLSSKLIRTPASIQDSVSNTNTDLTIQSSKNRRLAPITCRDVPLIARRAGQPLC